MSAYGITPRSLHAATGGFSAKAAYRAAGEDGRTYFLKVYDKTLPTTRFFVERIDAYMPALARLSASPLLRGRIAAPVAALDGSFRAETGDDVCVLFMYVNGAVPGIQGITRMQTEELAQTLALLHTAGETDAIASPALAEDISLPFCGQLAGFLSGLTKERGQLGQIVSPNADLLRSAIQETLRLRDTLRLNYAPIVLCHGDAHGNNVIQSERLVLVDWEDLRLAPAEADLFIHAWHPHGDALLQAYSAARQGYRINRALLHFYVLRRRIEDVWVDIQRLTQEAPGEEETAKLLDWVSSGIEDVRRAYHKKP